MNQLPSSLGLLITGTNALKCLKSISRSGALPRVGVGGVGHIIICKIGLVYLLDLTGKCKSEGLGYFF